MWYLKHLTHQMEVLILQQIKKGDAFMNYYVIKQYSEGGVRKTPANYPYQTRPEAERQYNLLCAAAWKNEMDVALDTMLVDFESVEIGTIEHGSIDRKFFNHAKPVIPEEPVESEEPIE